MRKKNKSMKIVDKKLNPLYFPRKYENGFINNFLNQICYWENTHARKNISFQLVSRDPDNYLMVWKGYNFEIREIAEKCSEIIKGWMHWPNACYIPEDPLWLLLYPDYDGLEDAMVLHDIDKTFEIDLPELDVKRNKITFVEFVIAIQQELKSSKRINKNLPPLYCSDKCDVKCNLICAFVCKYTLLSHRCVKRKIKNQLFSRAYMDYLGAWKDYETDTFQIVKKVSTIIKKYSKWPNSYFIPTDPLRLILYPNRDLNCLVP